MIAFKGISKKRRKVFNMVARLTKQQLIDANACVDQVVLFDQTFGDSVNVTVKRAVRVVDLFDWYWARKLLSAPARAEYNKVCAAAWATAYIQTCKTTQKGI